MRAISTKWFEDWAEADRCREIRLSLPISKCDIGARIAISFSHSQTWAPFITFTDEGSKPLVDDISHRRTLVS